jgi:hypothetical protein
MAKGFERDAETFRQIGEALFGSNWQTTLADVLLFNPGLISVRKNAVRTVQRWADGSRTVPAGVWDDLEELLTERAKAQATWAENLGAWKVLNA